MQKRKRVFHICIFYLGGIKYEQHISGIFQCRRNNKKSSGKSCRGSGADLYEIRPKVPYTDADLNWMDKKSRSSIEMSDKSFRPEIAGNDAHIEKYDTILIGFPKLDYVA